jgi:hypothetical protein
MFSVVRKYKVSRTASECYLLTFMYYSRNISSLIYIL